MEQRHIAYAMELENIFRDSIASTSAIEYVAFAAAALLPLVGQGDLDYRDAMKVVTAAKKRAMRDNWSTASET